jgi:predicted DNA-binding transcriptional regulator AlpA
MDTTTDAHDQLIAAIHEIAAKIDGLEGPIRLDLPDGQYLVPETTVRVCTRGDHLAVAHRWERRCDGCHQSITDGAVGLHIHFTDGLHPRCIDGYHGWQHGCSEPMPPTERIVDLDNAEIINQLADAVEQARLWAREVGEEEHEAVTDAIAGLAQRIVTEVIAELYQQVSDKQQKAASEVRRRLLGELNYALRRLADGADPDDVATGDYMAPGVQVEPGEPPLAWDHDPLDLDGPPIVVTPADFDLIGAAEVARLAGLSERSVRTYVLRRTIVDPVIVAGSDALVWRRSEVLDWIAQRPGRGRPT